MRICNKCHEIKPLIDYYLYRPSVCKQCLVSATLAYRKANPERAKETANKAHRRYYLNHRDKRLYAAYHSYRRRKAEGRIDRQRKNELGRLWYARNPDKIKASRQKLNATDHAKQYHREYAVNNRQRLRTIKKRWKERNPEAVRFYKRITQRRRQTRMIGQVTAKQWKRIILFYGRACAICHIPESEVPLTIDHFIPLSKGGTNNWYNVWPLCLSCNSRKHDKIPTESHPPHVAILEQTADWKVA